MWQLRMTAVRGGGCRPYPRSNVEKCGKLHRTARACERRKKGIKTRSSFYPFIFNPPFFIHYPTLQDKVRGCRDSLDDTVKDHTNFQALLEEACDDLADAGMKTIDLKRKADDAHDRTCSHRDWCRRARRLKRPSPTTCSSNCLPRAVVWHTRQRQQRDDAWQARCSRRSSGGHDGHDGRETTEVVLLERPQ